MSKFLKKNLLTTLIILLLSPSIGLSDEKVQIDPVFVSASRGKEKQIEVPYSIVTIEKEDLEKDQTNNIIDILSQYAIIDTVHYPNSSAQVSMRGMVASADFHDLNDPVIFLIDGKRVGSKAAYYLSPTIVERIEIIRGPASVQYGSNAMGGIINIITKKPKEKIKGQISLKAGSFGFFESAALLSGKSGSFDFIFSLSRKKQDDYETGDGVEYLNTAYDKEENISFNLGYEFFEKHHVSVSTMIYKADDIGSPNALATNDLTSKYDQESTLYDFSYEGKNDDSDILWELGYSTSKNQKDYFDGSYNALYKYESETTNFQSQISKYLQNDAKFTLGADSIDYDITSAFSPKKSKSKNMAAFFLGKYPYKKSIFNAGLRYSTLDLEVLENEGGKKDIDNLSYSFGVSYFLKKNLKLKANYAESFMAPSPWHIAANYESYGAKYVGNPDIDPEKNKTYEFGFDYAQKASITYFYSNYDDKITQYVTDGGNNSYKNVNKAKLTGIEASFSYPLEEILKTQIKIKPYLNLTSMIDYEDKETNKDLNFITEFKASYGVAFSEVYGFSCKINFQHFGKQNIEVYDANYNKTIQEKSSFNVANLSILKEIAKFKGQNLKLALSVKNLFDKDYSYVEGYPMQGRALYANLSYEF